MTDSINFLNQIELLPLNQEKEKSKNRGGRPPNSIWDDISRGNLLDLGNLKPLVTSVKKPGHVVKFQNLRTTLQIIVQKLQELLSENILANY